jgi:hypothetical protein
MGRTKEKPSYNVFSFRADDDIAAAIRMAAGGDLSKFLRGSAELVAAMVNGGNPPVPARGQKEQQDEKA